MFLEQKTLVTISCRFFKSHSIFVLAIFLRPYMIEVSKKIANSKIEWRIKNLQLIVTNLFLTNKPQKTPWTAKNTKKNQFSQLWELIETLVFHKDLKPNSSPRSAYSLYLWYPKNSPKTPQKAPETRKISENQISHLLD